MTFLRPRKGDSGSVLIFPFTREGTMTPSVSKHAPGRARPSTENRPTVFHNAPLRHELYRTLYESKLSAEEIAWRLGISPSYLRRAVLTTESGVRFPADLLAALMRCCNCYRALELLAAECDHTAVPLPKIRRTKNSAAEVVNETAAEFHALMADLMSFFARPDAAAAAGIRSRLRAHLSAMAAIDLALRNYGQMDLPLEASA